MRIEVDLDLCQGNEICVAEAPEVFRVGERPGEYDLVDLIVESPEQGFREEGGSRSALLPEPRSSPGDGGVDPEAPVNEGPANEGPVNEGLLTEAWMPEKSIG